MNEKHTLRISPDGLRLTQSFESFTPIVTLSPSGTPVVGFGHSGHDIRVADVGKRRVTLQEATDLLRNDLAPLEQALNVLVTIPLKQCQYDALCDYLFTLGIARFQKSKVLKALNKGNFTLAASEIRFTLPDKASSRLKKRREAEYRLFIGQKPELPPLLHEETL